MASGQSDFLAEAVRKGLIWMEYQSPSDRALIGQLPTTDWRDEQWVLGYGLYVNTIAYTAFKLLGEQERAERIKNQMGHFTIKGQVQHRHVHEGLVLTKKPYYAMWSYKVYRSERFDLLGNSLAIISGIASASRTRRLIYWIEKECGELRRKGALAVDIPPCLFPYIMPGEPDWIQRYEEYNQPGEYHNGGIWPFVCGFYIAALVAGGKFRLARRKLLVLTELITKARQADVECGFN